MPEETAPASHPFDELERAIGKLVKERNILFLQVRIARKALGEMAPMGSGISREALANMDALESANEVSK